ncbi:CLUMA_CG015287, isoform A [Clunio marinus]|uniref:CLUMA_CG015287, isoform A n=1 Tax=Clunio marinus TaxID=568069 RepID=A0A1J1IQF3_9DIPT|nr:CLUMA_CG015287, isoform A [Clunio marinus]
MGDKELHAHTRKYGDSQIPTINDPIKNFNAFLSLENCEQFIEKQNHTDRVNKIREVLTTYIRETEFLYSK